MSGYVSVAAYAVGLLLKALVNLCPLIAAHGLLLLGPAYELQPTAILLHLPLPLADARVPLTVGDAFLIATLVWLAVVAYLQTYKRYATTNSLSITLALLVAICGALEVLLVALFASTTFAAALLGSILACFLAVSRAVPRRDYSIGDYGSTWHEVTKAPRRRSVGSITHSRSGRTDNSGRTNDFEEEPTRLDFNQVLSVEPGAPESEAKSEPRPKLAPAPPLAPADAPRPAPAAAAVEAPAASPPSASVDQHAPRPVVPASEPTPAASPPPAPRSERAHPEKAPPATPAPVPPPPPSAVSMAEPVPKATQVTQKPAAASSQAPWPAAVKSLNRADQVTYRSRPNEIADPAHRAAMVNAAVTSLQAPEPTVVEASVYAPSTAAVGGTFLLQVLLHTRADIIRAARLARMVDAKATPRGRASLDAHVIVGQSIDLMLDCPDLVVEDPWATVTWTGAPARAAFEAHVPKSAPEKISGAVIASIDGVPIGEVSFVIHSKQPEVAEGRSAPTAQLMSESGSTPAETRARHFRRAFISYARKDFEQVSLFAQGLASSGVKTFVDVSEIEPGDEWLAVLEREIDGADAVFLMWSRNAPDARWMLVEARRAIEIAKIRGFPVPRLVPITLHREAPSPPEFLAHLHFDSPWLALREAQRRPLFVTD